MKKSTSTRKKINPAIKREKNHKPLHKEPAVEECCNNEVDKINQNLVDRISELPDDILVSIISRLTFKEATATSILSTRWRHLYTHIISLDFRFPFKPEKLYLRGYDEEIQEEEFTDCISRINHTLNSYKGGQVLKDFRLRMPCLAGADIENWLEFALSREVQIIDIHMVYCIKATHESNYTFPLSTLISKNGSQAAILPGLKCLKELSLTAVHVKDQDIEILLSYFVALERLSIESPRRTWYIKTLKNVSVVGHRTLKHLNISSSWSVKSIEVRDTINLVSLSFYHLPPTYVLQLDNVPNLVEFTVSDEKRNTLAKILPRISCIHDQLLRLKLCVFRDHIMVRNRIMPRICTFLSREPIYMLPKLINLKHLELDVFMNNKYGTQELFPLIAACPSLEELELKFLWLSEVKYIDRKLNKCRVERKCPSCNLRKVRLSRYSGSTPELEFVLYIVNNAVTLQELMIVEACDRTREIRRRAIARACRRNSVSFII